MVTIAEMTSDRDCMNCKPKIFGISLFTEKSWLTPARGFKRTGSRRGKAEADTSQNAS